MNATNSSFDPVILAGYSAQDWGEKFTRHLAAKTGHAEFGVIDYRIFANDETSPVLTGIRKYDSSGIVVGKDDAGSQVPSKDGVNLRSADVVIIVGAAGSPNNNIIEAQMLTDIAKSGAARTITTVVPNLHYGRQDDNFEQRAPVGLLRTLDNLFARSDYAIICDPHNAHGTTLAMAKYPANYQHVHFAPVFSRQISELFAAHVIQRDNCVVMGLDAGGASRMRQDFAAAVREVAGLAMPERGKDLPYLDKARDRTTGKSSFSGVKNIAPEELRGKDVVIFEDMVDTGGSAIDGAKYLKEVCGVRSVSIFATNGHFSAKREAQKVLVPGEGEQRLKRTMSRKNRNPAASIKLIDASVASGVGIDTIFVSNNLDHRLTEPRMAQAIKSSPVIHEIDVTPFMAEIVWAVHNPDRSANSVSNRLSGSITVPYKPTALKAKSPLRNLRK